MLWSPFSNRGLIGCGYRERTRKMLYISTRSGAFKNLRRYGIETLEGGPWLNRAILGDEEVT